MKILILSFFLLPFSFLFSQGNLQFNQVITGNGLLGANTSSSIYAVPTGKIAKIEAINNINGSTFQIGINSSEVQLAYFKFPFWLKAGDTFYVRDGRATGAPQNFHFSLIEFNIIP